MAMNGDAGVSVFAKYIDKPEREPTPPPILPTARMLLNWLQHNWTQPTIRARDIQRLGPNSIRDRESTLKLTEILTRRGWLIPLKTRSCDMRRWQITIGPD